MNSLSIIRETRIQVNVIFQAENDYNNLDNETYNIKEQILLFQQFSIGFKKNKT